MAHSTHVSAPVSLLAPINRIMSAIGRGLVRMGENDSRMRKIDALNAMSDKELAARGIERRDIPRYVLSDYFWI